MKKFGDLEADELRTLRERRLRDSDLGQTLASTEQAEIDSRGGLPVAIYARISRDRAGAGLGVDRQEADCRALAARLGWHVVGVFVDNDISAYSGATRPQYRALLDAVRTGEVQGVIAWHPDRLHRRATELEEFVGIAEAHHLQVQTVTAGTVDLSSASGRMVARMLGAAAQHEVDHARERMKRAKEQMAQAGMYRGGPRPFGYDKDGVTVREDEAAIIREATVSILAGRTLAAVARDLNERGAKTSADKPWTYGRLKEMLIRPRNAGLLSRGDPSRPEGGGNRAPFEVVEGKAVWPAVISSEEWRALMTVLTDPSRRKQNGNEVRWLGSGLYLCGLCGGPMRPAPYGGTARSVTRTRRHLYRCTRQAHLTVSATRTDEFVLDVLAAKVNDPDLVAALRPGDAGLTAAREKRSTLAARLSAFERDYAAGVITGLQLQKATKDVSEELTEVDDQLTRALRRSTSSAVLGAPDPGAALRAAPLDVRRAVLASVLCVEVLPASERGAAWSSSRLRITSAAGS